MVEGNETLIEVNSNLSQGLLSIVKESGGPIKELQQKAQDLEDQSKEKNVEVQQKVAGEDNEVNDYIQKNLERNISLQKVVGEDNEVVWDSNNKIHVSQIPSINLQVELNPREARKELRARISQSCMNDDDNAIVENSTDISSWQEYQPNSILQELFFTEEPN